MNVHDIKALLKDPSVVVIVFAILGVIFLVAGALSASGSAKAACEKVGGVYVRERAGFIVINGTYTPHYNYSCEKLPQEGVL